MEKQANIVKIAFIRKVKGKGWCVFGHKKTKGGKRQNFGCYKSKAAAKKRLGQIYFFKGRGALDGLIGVADDLDRRGFLHFADAIMDCLERIVAASLGECLERPASVTIGKVAGLLEKKGEAALAERLDGLLPAVLDVECGAGDCPDCPDMAVEADLGRCGSVTRQVSADKLYAMAARFRQMYREAMIGEDSFEYRKFRELRYMLRTGFLFPPPEGQGVPKDAANWWDHFEKEAGE